MRAIGIRTPTRDVVQIDPRGSVLELVAVAADRQDQPEPMFHDGNGGVPFAAIFPMGAEDARIRQSHAVDPGRFYPLERLNQSTMIDVDRNMGHEGSDWQNPYAWAAKGVLVYPNPASSGLSPAYGVNKSSDAGDVALNVRATAGMLEVGNLS